MPAWGGRGSRQTRIMLFQSPPSPPGDRSARTHAENRHRTGTEQSRNNRLLWPVIAISAEPSQIGLQSGRYIPLSSQSGAALEYQG